MKAIASFDPQHLLDRIAVEHGEQTADAVAFVMLEPDERIAVLEARQVEIRARLDALVDDHPSLKSLPG